MQVADARHQVQSLVLQQTKRIISQSAIVWDADVPKMKRSEMNVSVN